MRRLLIILTLLASVSGCSAARIGWNHGSQVGRVAQRCLSTARQEGKEWLALEADFDPTVRNFLLDNGKPDFIYVVNANKLAFAYSNLDTGAVFTRTGITSTSQVMRLSSIPDDFMSVLPRSVQGEIFHRRQADPARRTRSNREPQSTIRTSASELSVARAPMPGMMDSAPTARPQAKSPANRLGSPSGLTFTQQNAARSAESYLRFSGFSRRGLIDQLSSEHGDQYSVSDAAVAVDSLDIDWNRQAARSAAQYLNMSGFSCRGLIDQLSSEHGDQYSEAQATHGAIEAGVCEGPTRP